MEGLHMTETEAMAGLIGRPATITEPTHTGERTILGAVATPLFIETTEAGEEIVTALTIEGAVILERITGLPLPLEPETAIRAEFPAHLVTLL